MRDWMYGFRGLGFFRVPSVFIPWLASFPKRILLKDPLEFLRLALRLAAWLNHGARQGLISLAWSGPSGSQGRWSGNQRRQIKVQSRKPPWARARACGTP